MADVEEQLAPLRMILQPGANLIGTGNGLASGDWREALAAKRQQTLE